MDQPRIRLKSDNHVLQRLQIGSVGVIAVLLMVAMASLVLNSASDQMPDDIAVTEGTADEAKAAEADAQPNEPLVDLGVVPDIAPEESLADPDEVLTEDNLPDLPAAPDGTGEEMPVEGQEP
ncbi:MAG: hypothetical protein AAFX04_02760 [Pseudomonadota bacterium]